jgi:medium-chain acyl-[acyl-carrier-protein] hydrolase
MLPSDVDLVPIQLPGRESRWREKTYDGIDALVDAMAHDLQPYFDVPFVFFGHSMGALVAFEMARFVSRVYGRTPAHLFVSGHRAPHLPSRFPSLHHLPDDTFVREMQSRYGGIPDAILQDAELLSLFLPTLRADMKMIETYRYIAGSPLDCPLSVFGGWQDKIVNEAELDAWRQYTSQSVALRMFPGDHFYMQAHLALLMQAITEALMPGRESHLLSA